ncbi:MAG: hypothetical protein KGI80_05690 [Verrucomicrobiota bacterium]|nr:hypothetical protein [Verrucomicrobiota bacterium]
MNLQFSVFIAFLLSVYEVFLLLAYFHGVIPTALLFLLHGVALFASLALSYLAYLQKSDCRFLFLLFLSVLAAGPLGSLGFLLFAGIYLFVLQFAVPMDVWFAELFPLKKPTAFSQLFVRVRSKWDDYAQPHELSSFFDIIQFGTEYQKLALFDLIVKEYHPEYGPILEKGLKDRSNSVRVASAAVVQEIERQFERKLAELLHASPDSSLSLKLAEHYDHFSRLGLPNRQRIRETEESALYYYQEYLKSNPGNIPVLFAVLRLLHHLDRMSDFLSLLEEYRKYVGNFPTILQSWHLEALYRLQRYEEISRWR